MCGFILRYLILLDAIVNEIVFLTSFSDGLLLVYRNTIDFCILVLYPATLLNSLMSSNSFFGGVLGFSMYSSIPSANSDRFTSSFPIWIPFISFSCHIAMARTSNTMLNESGKSGHLCLVPDLHLFRTECDVSCQLVIYGLYYVEVCSLYTHCLESSIINGVEFLSQALSSSIEMIISFLFFNLLIWCITLIDMQILNHPCIAGINPTCSWCMILLMYC